MGPFKKAYLGIVGLAYGEFSYHNATVMLAPATSFYATPGMGKNEVRIGYVLNLEDLSAAMDCLERAVEVYGGRRK